MSTRVISQSHLEKIAVIRALPLVKVRDVAASATPPSITLAASPTEPPAPRARWGIGAREAEATLRPPASGLSLHFGLSYLSRDRLGGTLVTCSSRDEGQEHGPCHSGNANYSEEALKVEVATLVMVDGCGIGGGEHRGSITTTFNTGILHCIRLRFLPLAPTRPRFGAPSLVPSGPKVWILGLRALDMTASTL